MKLATTTSDFYGYTETAAEAVAAFEETGFKHLDYCFYNVIYKGSPFLTDDWRREVHEAAETAARLGFDFVQAHTPNYNPLDKGADHEAGMKALLRSIEACGELGIKNTVLHLGCCDEIKYPEDRKLFFEKNLEFCRSLFSTAEKYGVNICVENSAEQNMGGRYFLMTGKECADFVKELGHPLFHVGFDVGHSNMRDTDIYTELVNIGDELRALHLQDNFGTYDEHMLPLMGSLDTDAVMQALIKLGYNGYFTLEADGVFTATPGFPHGKKLSPSVTERRLYTPSLELKRQLEALFYSTGKYILEQYSCFED